MNADLEPGVIGNCRISRPIDRMDLQTWRSRLRRNYPQACSPAHAINSALHPGRSWEESL